MNVLFVANDPSVCDAQSQVRARMRAYARALGEVWVASAGPVGASETHEDALHLYPIQTGKVFRLFALMRRARTLVRTAPIDVVSAQDPFEYGLAALMAVRGTRSVLHLQLHTDPFAPDFARLSLANRVRTWLMPFVLRRAVRIRVVSERLKNEVERRYHPHAPVSVVPVYTDLSRFRAVHRAPEKGMVLWVGRFEREKDPLCALETLAALRASGMDARLVMLGTGRLMRAVTARAKVRGLEPFLELPGHVDPLPYLVKAELVLATSRYEGYGLAILEALAARVPVLSTPVGIAEEAGAVIAPREAYCQKAAALLAEGAPIPMPPPDPYASFKDYLVQYVEDIRCAATETLARSPATHKRSTRRN